MKNFKSTVIIAATASLVAVVVSSCRNSTTKSETSADSTAVEGSQLEIQLSSSRTTDGDIAFHVNKLPALLADTPVKDLTLEMSAASDMIIDSDDSSVHKGFDAKPKAGMWKYTAIISYTAEGNNGTSDAVLKCTSEESWTGILAEKMVFECGDNKTKPAEGSTKASPAPSSTTSAGPAKGKVEISRTSDTFCAELEAFKTVTTFKLEYYSFKAATAVKIAGCLIKDTQSFGTDEAGLEATAKSIANDHAICGDLTKSKPIIEVKENGDTILVYCQF